MSSDFLYISRKPLSRDQTTSPSKEIKLAEWINLVHADDELVPVTMYKGYAGEEHYVARWNGHDLPGPPGQFFLWLNGMVVYDNRYMDEQTWRKVASIALALAAKVYDVEGNELGVAR